MEYTALNDGNKMPLVGLGTFPMKGDQLRQAVKVALCCGYELFDTAWLYNNEFDLGLSIKGVDRSKLFITSKLHFDSLFFYYNRRFDIGIPRSSVKKQYQLSCKKLGLKYCDLYLLHAPFRKYNVLYSQMERLKNVKSIGVSNFSIEQLSRLIKSSRIIPAVNQIEMNPFCCDRRFVDYCNNNNVRIEAFSPFGRGLLTKEIMGEKKLLDIGNKYNKTVAQIIIRWLTQQGIVAIPRSSNPDNIKQNIDVFDFALTDKEIETVYSLNKNIHTVGGKIRVG